jgi:hypothetical protein
MGHPAGLANLKPKRDSNERLSLKLVGGRALQSYTSHVPTENDKQWIGERLEKVETTLLTEFHKWASPLELRQKSHAAALRALDTEVESLSDRLKNLENR